jgi:hypothetical protein
MPALLRPDQFDPWFGSAGKEMLVPAAEDMPNKVSVSQWVNSSRRLSRCQILIVGIQLVCLRQRGS